MFHRQIAIGAFIALTVALALLGGRRFRTEPEPISPEEVIWRRADAARAGDVNAYLDCYVDPLRRDLRKAAAELGEAGFQAYLRQLDGDLTGIAVAAAGPMSAAEAELRVEYVYRGKKEAQRHHVRFLAGKWRIDQVEQAASAGVLFPYGAPIRAQVWRDPRSTPASSDADRKP